MQPSRFSYNDPLLKRRRRLVRAKIMALVGVGVVIVGAGVYGLFFSPVFAIRDISIIGLETIDSTAIHEKIQQALDQKRLGFIPWGRNILFFKGQTLADDFLQQYPQLASVKIERHFYHGVEAHFVERKVVGIWCTEDSGCVFFDADGTTWGHAPHSSGALVTVVEDERPDAPIFDSEYFHSITQASLRLGQMELGAKRASIPKDSFHDFWIYTFKDVPIMMSLDSDINKQLDALKLFLSQKAPANWHPSYIDLRIDGRFYYK